MGSHATWYSRGLGDGAAEALGLPVRWTVVDILDAAASLNDYAVYARARAEAAERTRRVIVRRRIEEQRRRDHAALLAQIRLAVGYGWAHTDLLRLVSSA